MAGTSTANWRAAMAKATVEPIHTVTIQTPTTTYNAASGITLDLGYDVAVEDVAGFGKHHDPVTRRTSIDQIEVELSDAWARPIIVAERIKGSKITIKTGAAGLAGADYRTRFIGLVDSYKVRPKQGGVALYCVDALTYALQNQTRRQWLNKHPLLVIYQILTDAGVPASLIDTAAFAYTSYTTTISHWVIDQAAIERFAISGSIIGLGTTPTGLASIDTPGAAFERLRDLQSDPSTALSLLETVSMLLPGMVTVGDDGKITFVEYDDSAAAEVHFSTSDYSDFETVDQYGNQTNSVTVGIGANGREIEYEASNAASQTAFAYPGESARVVARDIDTGWIGGLTGIGADMTNVQTTMVPAGARLFGFCGSHVPDDWPTSAQDADSKLSASRVGYWLIDDSAGREIVKVTALVLDESARASAAVSDGDSLFPTDTPVPAFGTATIVRAQLGTAAASHVYKKTTTETDGTATGWTMAYDITIPVVLAEYHNKRFGYGCPIIAFKASSFGADIYEQGDVITIDNDEFAGYGLNGLSSSSKFEIIGKEFDPFTDQPGPRFTCALIRTDAVALTYTALSPGFATNSFRHMIDAARSAGASVPFIDQGFDISDGGGLVVDVAPGIGGNWFNRRVGPAVQNLTLRASRDSYISFDPHTGATIVRDVATGAGDPGREAFEAGLGWAAAGAATLSSVTVDKDDRALSVGRVDSPLSRAYVTGTQYIPKGSVWTTLVIGAIETDTGGNYSTTTYRFTAPDAGNYAVLCQIYALVVEAGKSVRLAIVKNVGGTPVFVTLGDPVFNDSGASRSQVAPVSTSNLPLAAGDTIEIQGFSDNAAATTIVVGSAYSVFEIRRVR